MARGVDHFGPISPRSPMLIEHRQTILLGDIRRGKLMLKAQKSTKGFKISILEFYVIITANHSHGILRELILQPKNQLLSM
jgi:hypothetical protein